VRRLLKPILAVLLMHPAAAALAVVASPGMPTITAETDWLKIPPQRVIGDVSAVAVGPSDSVWILQRPASVAEADRARALPPVVQFDRNGRYVRSFGGPGQGYDWPTTEHSLAVDKRGHVWITGSYRVDATRADDMLLEFSGDGTFIRQVGSRGGSKGDADTANLHAAADVYVDDAASEVYVADGYGNRRVIVFDTRTGAFKRMWSAFGAPPPVEPAPAPRVIGTPFTPETGDGPPGFNGVHGVEVSRDGLVYVSDRNNQRIQVFTPAGKYLKQVFVDRNMPSQQTASGIAFSPDAKQRYLYVADWGNEQLLVYDRASLKLLGTFGHRGAAAGEFKGPHLVATDSRGFLYVAEVEGRRVQRLKMGAPAR
jgi:DNA-binding beta-propeller fold protein YncE